MLQSNSLTKRLVIAGFFGSLLLLVVAIVPSVVSAQSNGQDGLIAEQITISPTSQPFSFDVGGRTTNMITVINDGQIGYEFKVYASPYGVKNEQYDPQFVESENFRNAASWIQFPSNKFKLEPGSRVEVPYTVLVPQNAAPGGHYAVIFAETQPKPGNTESVVRKKRVGTILLATVKGDIRMSGQFVGNATSMLQTTQPLKAVVRVRNDGNTDFKAKITTRVTNILGNVTFKAENEYNVLPGTTRRITTEWPQSPFIGIFKVEQSVDFLDKSEMVSRYVLIMPSWGVILLVIIVAGGIGSLVVKRKLGR